MRRSARAWRLLETGARPGAWNMGCDEAVLAALERGAAPPTLRLYGWSPPAVSLGRHQPDPEETAAERLAALGVDWVRRPTGGRAVWHGLPEAELTYSVAARLDAPELAGGLSAAYRRIHEAIAAGLVRLGVAPVLAPPRAARMRAVAHRPTSRVACFAASVPGEILVAGGKLVGSAQRRGRSGLLQHGSIPLAGDQRVLEEAWPGSLAAGAATTLSAAAGRRIGFAEAARAVAAGFREVLGVELEPGELSAAEHAAIAAPATERAAHHGV
jgi:lipoate-protein ligase A